MSENSYKSIRNSAIASLIAGVILLSIPSIRNYAIRFLNFVWLAFAWLWHMLISTYALPGWALIFLMFLSFIGLLGIYLALKKTAEEPDHKKYVEDSIFNAKWRWQWFGDQIEDLWCYCPRCDATLVYDDSACHNFRNDISKTDFICEHCGHTIVSSVSGGDKNYAVSAAKREIERRIRTEEYKKNEQKKLS